MRTARCGNSAGADALAAARRGVTLIEAVLFISIALGLIVGGLVFFQQASLSSRVNQQVRSLSAMLSETRAIYQSQPEFPVLAPIDAVGIGFDFSEFQDGALQIGTVLINSGSVPSSEVASDPGPNGSRLITAWNTELYISVGSGRVGSAGAREPVVNVILYDIPRQACSRLVQFSPDGNSAFSSGVGVAVGVGVESREIGYAELGGVSPDRAGDFCRQSLSSVAFRIAMFK